MSEHAGAMATTDRRGGARVDAACHHEPGGRRGRQPPAGRISGSGGQLLLVPYRRRRQSLAGGRAIATPFGSFYSPNITPDPETGIGRWTDAEFLKALREGLRPDGANYFPVFPYPSFTRITDNDALAIKTYLFSLPPVRQDNRPHDVRFPFSWRFLQTGWKLLFFTPGPFELAPERSAAYNRGAYLVTALAHCGECHTPGISSAPCDPASG
jgi:hypothetical protein